MGQSTDGILCYGFCLDEDAEYPWTVDEESMDFEDYLATLGGLSEPETSNYEDRSWKTYWRRKEANAESIGVDLVCHCSDECPMYILAAHDSVKVANRGTPEELGQTLHIGMHWKEDLYQFCQKAGVEFKEPQWILCSMWG